MRTISRITPLLSRTLALVLVVSLPQAALAAANSEKNAYFGAVHVHTNYSFDAFTNGTLATPANAYQWAQGEAIPGGGGGPDIQLKTPLDFYAVSDHAEWMGVFKEMANPRSALSEHPLAKRITSPSPNTRMQAFAEVLRDFSGGKRDETLSNPQLSRSVWSDIVATADVFYQPGEFTTFPAFEWSGTTAVGGDHNVYFLDDDPPLFRARLFYDLRNQHAYHGPTPAGKAAHRVS